MFELEEQADREVKDIMAFLPYPDLELRRYNNCLNPVFVIRRGNEVVLILSVAKKLEACFYLEDPETASMLEEYLASKNSAINLYVFDHNQAP